MLLSLVGLTLLLGASSGAAVADGDGAASTTAGQETAEAGRGSCPGCARAETPAEGPRWGRAGERGGCCGGMGRQWGRGPGRGGGGRGGGPAVRETIQALVHDYRQFIEREVEDVENGVVTLTRAPENAAAAQAIERHVREMKDLLESGRHIRMWDPLFRELLAHADEISMKIEPVEGGMRVTETSQNPDVVALIRAHARKVTEFIEHGPAAVHQETPLPAAYGAGG